MTTLIALIASAVIAVMIIGAAARDDQVRAIQRGLLAAASVVIFVTGALVMVLGAAHLLWAVSR